MLHCLTMRQMESLTLLMGIQNAGSMTHFVTFRLTQYPLSAKWVPSTETKNDACKVLLSNSDAVHHYL